jgi:hypothetical protein
MQEAMAHFTTLGEEQPQQPQQQQQTVVAFTAAEQEVQAHVSTMKHWQDMTKSFWGAEFKHLPLVAHRFACIDNGNSIEWHRCCCRCRP